MEGTKVGSRPALTDVFYVGRCALLPQWMIRFLGVPAARRAMWQFGSPNRRHLHVRIPDGNKVTVKRGVGWGVSVGLYPVSQAFALFSAPPDGALSASGAGVPFCLLR